MQQAERPRLRRGGDGLMREGEDRSRRCILNNSLGAEGAQTETGELSLIRMNVREPGNDDQTAQWERKVYNNCVAVHLFMVTLNIHSVG
jgi:hypothetical protein